MKKNPGRPRAPQRPTPVSWRPETQEQREKYLELGGAKWIRRMINWEIGISSEQRSEMIKAALEAGTDKKNATKELENWQYNPQTRTWSPK